VLVVLSSGIFYPSEGDPGLIFPVPRPLFFPPFCGGPRARVSGGGSTIFVTSFPPFELGGTPYASSPLLPRPPPEAEGAFSLGFLSPSGGDRWSFLLE